MNQLQTDINTRTKIFQVFKSGDIISIYLIQQKCSVGYPSAQRTFENLIEDGLIKTGKSSHEVYTLK